MLRTTARVVSFALIAMALLIGSASSGSASPGKGKSQDPVVHGPVKRGNSVPALATTIDLAAFGYTEHEYFLSGKARAYERDDAWTSAGEWDVRPAGTEQFRTRLLVRAPQDPDDFNGTVLVEWLNVSGGSDADVDFRYMSNELLRDGYAWVGVSAQSAGVNSTGGSTLGESVVGLKHWSTKRYGSLKHPGDAYSYDIFTQAGRALRSSKGQELLPGFEVDNIIAVGQSQSAFRMITYANAIQPVANVYDGLIIHARSGVAAPLGDGAIASGEGPGGPNFPSPVRVRTDLDVPVMQLVTETELFETGGGAPDTMFGAARQPDTDLLRTWEIAGTAHSDAYLVEYMNAMYQSQFEDVRDLTPVLGLINDGPQQYVSSAALRAMRTWIVDGIAPPSADPIVTQDGAIVRDEFGNALGGVRTPQLDVPIATLSGETTLVPLNGFTQRFTPEQLQQIYGTKDAYVAQFEAATNAAVAEGFVLPEDADAMIEQARNLPPFG